MYHALEGERMHQQQSDAMHLVLGRGGYYNCWPRCCCFGTRRSKDTIPVADLEIDRSTEWPGSSSSQWLPCVSCLPGISKMPFTRRPPPNLNKLAKLTTPRFSSRPAARSRPRRCDRAPERPSERSCNAPQQPMRFFRSAHQPNHWANRSIQANRFGLTWRRRPDVKRTKEECGGGGPPTGISLRLAPQDREATTGNERLATYANLVRLDRVQLDDGGILCCAFDSSQSPPPPVWMEMRPDFDRVQMPAAAATTARPFAFACWNKLLYRARAHFRFPD